MYRHNFRKIIQVLSTGLILLGFQQIIQAGEFDIDTVYRIYDSLLVVKKNSEDIDQKLFLEYQTRNNHTYFQAINGSSSYESFRKLLPDFIVTDFTSTPEISDAQSFYKNLSALKQPRLHYGMIDHSCWLALAKFALVRDMTYGEFIQESRLGFGKNDDLLSTLSFYDETFSPSREIIFGDLALKEHHAESAYKFYGEVLDNTKDPFLLCEAWKGIGKAFEKQRNYRKVVELLFYALANGGFSDDTLFLLGKSLIRIGRVSDARKMFQFVLEINPCQQDAHYYLGNGYSAYNYSQIKELYPECFVENGERILAEISDSSKNDSNLVIKDNLVRLIDENPGWIEPIAWLASILFQDGNLSEAEWWCYKALKLCPEYGRAHAILAKIYETRKLKLSIYHKRDDSHFLDTPMPEIPGVEKYVINWDLLSQRHQKRVALSLEPWKEFIPVLEKTGNTHYIKPLHEKLSQCPGLESLENQVIGLDGRLWDDVRGVGGYNTVTGIEDVERLIYGGYNTVLHELTHQVHSILPEDEKQQIEKLYRDAKSREAEGQPSFMSRYQSLTVWEYFAEGVNSYYSPKNHPNDSNEIVRERLEKMDNPLLELVENYREQRNMDKYLTVGMINAAFAELDNGEVESGLEKLNQVPVNKRSELAVLNAYSYLYSLLDKDSLALNSSEMAIKDYPANSASYLQHSNTLQHTARDRSEAINCLLSGLERKDLDSRMDIYLELARLNWLDGKYDQAVQWCDSILINQPDNPHALWQKALCYSDSSLAHFPREKNSILLKKAKIYYQKALELRSGNVDLWLDYSRLFIQSGNLDEAENTVKEAETLKPDNVKVKTYCAWLEKLRGNNDKLLETWNTFSKMEGVILPDILRILALSILEGDEKNRLEEKIKMEINSKAPGWIYDPTGFSYVEQYLYPYWQIKLLQ